MSDLALRGPCICNWDTSHSPLLTSRTPVPLSHWRNICMGLHTRCFFILPFLSVSQALLVGTGQNKRVRLGPSHLGALASKGQGELQKRGCLKPGFEGCLGIHLAGEAQKEHSRKRDEGVQGGGGSKSQGS